MKGTTMSDNKLLNKAITLSAKEEKLQGGKPVAKIKDEKGLTYTVYKFKQDGTESVAWGQLGKLSLGQTVQIGYVEDIGDSKDGSVSVTYRTIRNFNEDIGNGVQNAIDQGKDPYKSKSSVSEGSGNDEFGRRLGVHGLVNGMLANSNIISNVREPQDVSGIVALAIQIEDEINKQLNPSKFRQTVERTAPNIVTPPEEELPTIQQGDPDLNVEGIPF
jgi:hypothetical protein